MNHCQINGYTFTEPYDVNQGNKPVKKLYFIAITIRDDTGEAIQGIKESFAKRYACRNALKLPPHITLIPPFRFTESGEKTLVETLEALCNKLKPFPLVIKNFNAFPPRVIYLEPLADTCLQEVQHHLKTRTVEQLGIKLRDNRPFRPHITIASRDLSMEMFARAWQEYQKASFFAEVVIDDISLYKHDGKKWHELATFRLKA